jgi:hypothetical protein
MLVGYMRVSSDSDRPTVKAYHSRRVTSVWPAASGSEK